jgi:hypothetical protein
MTRLQPVARPLAIFTRSLSTPHISAGASQAPAYAIVRDAKPLSASKQKASSESKDAKDVKDAGQKK